MTKQEVIENVLMSEGFRVVAEKITQSSQYLDDIIQDIALQIMEMPQEKFEGIRSPKSFCIGIVWKQYNSSTSPFYKKYRQKGVIVEASANGLKDIPEEEYDVTDDIRLMAIMDELKSYGWYDEKLLLSYFTEGSFMKLHKKSGIHYQSVRKTVNAVKARLRNKLNPEI